MSLLRLRKLARDLWLARTRMGMMVLAISLSVLSVGSFLTARAIASREISANYLATHPASATLRIPAGVDAATLDILRAQPGVLQATAQASALTRVRVGDGTWRMLMLFASDPADPQRIVTVTMERGAWPPPADGVVLERTALPFLGTTTGGTVTVLAPGGHPKRVRITGSAHDGAVAPAQQEQTAYGYTTTAALARLGLDARLTDAKVLIGDRAGPSGDRAEIEAAAQRIGRLLDSRGVHVDHIEVPRPLAHPHQGQMNMVSFSLLAFGAASLLLSSVLVAAMLGGMVAGQTRQIGAMKAVGARTSQILTMYLVQTGAIAATATILALWPSAWLGRLLARQGARLLNLDLASTAVPVWVRLLEAAAGVGVPLLVALVPLARGSRISVREAVDDHGTAAPAVTGRTERALTRLRGLPRPQLMAARNLLRRKGRLALNIGLLGVSGAMFLTGLGAAGGWTALVDQGVAQRLDDLEIRLAGPAPAARLTELVRALPGVADAQAWARTATTVHVPGRIDVARVYPDDSHGSFTVLAPPADTSLLRLPLARGRWLRPGDTNAVVLNNLSSAQLPGVGVGDQVRLTVAGRTVTWRVVGIGSDFGSQATAYVTEREYAVAVGRSGTASVLRIVTDRHDPAARQAVLDRIEAALAAQDIPVEQVFRADELRSALDGHVLVLADALIALGLVMGLVGLLGLAANLATSVTERTREFGVLHTIGASPAQIRAIVVTEGTLTAALSILFAAVAAVPLIRLLGDFIGNQAFRHPLPFQFPAPALLVWTTLSLVGAAAAAAAAARRATRLTVRESLTAV
ncbi:FtsX-like permease family protein [Streptomyces sp. NPDC054833]